MGKPGNKKNIIKLLQENRNKQTAEEIADCLGIQRNTASAILNELARDEIVRKEKTRPVMFSYIEKDSVFSDDPFASFIGADKSLKETVEKCKLSAIYLKQDMPILLFGPSGAGKSLLAEYIYKYAKYIHTIPEDAPFVVLNCADYANNKELLSSVLFGYKKGAFTGAHTDTRGLIEEADNGYLFLDEVHRLSPEGQEKLFHYMDKGVVSRVGDNGHNIELNVRLIFATTEGKESMLDTFLRRIPVEVTLPPFHERTLEERYQLIIYLIHQETFVMECSFLVSSNVINRLLTFQGKGNIGSLRNIIKLSCTKAYNEAEDKKGTVPLKLRHLSDTQKFMTGIGSVPYVNQDVEISSEKESVQYILTTEQIHVYFPAETIVTAVYEYLEKKISKVRFRKIIYDEINHMIDDVIYREMDPFIQNLYNQAVNNILVYLQDNYGLKYNGVMEMVFVKILYDLNNQSDKPDDSQYEIIVRKLQPVMYRYYKMGLIFTEMIHQTMDYETSPWFVRLFVMLYFYSMAKEDGDYTNAIIVSHGPATASSIASTVNRVFETYIFEAFDMAYDTPKSEIVSRIKKYLKNTNTSKGLLIFVDMGSLLSISKDLKDDIEGDLGIVNNITTEMALEAGERILRHEDLQSIMDNILSHHVTKKSYVPSRQKPKAIVLCCITGLGTAVKMKTLLKECLEGIELEVVEVPFPDLQRNGSQCDVFRKYNVQFVVTTSKLEAEDYTAIHLNELIDKRGEEVIYATVGKYFDKEKVQKFIENIVRSFTIRNLIGQLTILNPDKILDDVEKAVTRLEILEGENYPIDLKKMLYIHICVMVERLILEKGQLSESNPTQSLKCRESFIKNLKESFSVIEAQYNVSINHMEIHMIYSLIKNI